MAHELVGIGNAIVDVLARVDNAFLEKHNMVPGSMQLVDEVTMYGIYGDLGDSSKCSGGSVANTMVGYSMLGGEGMFIGKVRDDAVGKIFRDDIQKVGVTFNTASASDGPVSAQCVVCVSEHDGTVERTMATHLGIAAQITEDDIDEDQIAAAKALYIEGYLWDSPQAKSAIRKAIDIAHSCDTEVVFTLSDSFCVERHRGDFLELLRNDVDLVFANEREISMMIGSDETNIIGIQLESWRCKHAAITRSSKGCTIFRDGEVTDVAAETVKVEDVTGAGDLFAAGYLYGYLHGYSPAESGQLAVQCAASVIQHIGARPETELKNFLRAA